MAHFSERQNTRNSRDRLVEEQNEAYMDSVRADQEKVDWLCSHFDSRERIFFLDIFSNNNVYEKKMNDVNSKKNVNESKKLNNVNFVNSLIFVIRSDRHSPTNHRLLNLTSFKYPFVYLQMSPFVVDFVERILLNFSLNSLGLTRMFPINSNYYGAIHVNVINMDK